MIDALMGRVIPAVVVSGILVLCFCMGQGAAAEFPNGPYTVIAWTLFAAACGAIVGKVSAIICWNLPLFGRIPHFPRIMTALCASLALAAPTAQLINGHRDAEFHRQTVSAVQHFAVNHFNQLDENKDGTITDTELERAGQRLQLTAEEGAQLAYLREQQSIAGHVTDSHDNTILVWVGSGDGNGVLTPITTTAYVYGITLNDLDSFSERMIERYKRW